MQLWDVAQSWILLKHIILAIKHVILNHFPSKLVEIVRVYKGYHVAVRFKAVSLSQNAWTATDSPVFCSLLRFGCGFFAVATTSDEPSSSLSLYFRIFAHFASRVTIPVTVSGSQLL